jgi:RecA/RadA recombinase
MAKEKVFTFEELNKKMSTISKYGATMDKSDISTIDHYINSGNYLLNACLTGSITGGYPNNRAVCLAGPSGTGKTYLILNAIREAQKLGYSIIFYDSENAVDLDLISKFGIEPTKFRYEPCNTVQEFRTSITNLTDSLIEQKDKGVALPKIMVVLDSAGNLATQKELEDAKSGSDKSDMTRAKILKSTFRILMTQLGICKIPLLFSNHTYMTQDLFAKQVGSGGTGPEYSASIILFLGKAKLKDGTVQTGIIVTIRPNKNRFAKPKTIKIHISFDKGMNPYVGLEDYISWDNCGIQRGSIISENDYNKLKEGDQQDCRLLDEDENGKKRYFQPKDRAQKLIVKHLGDGVKLNELFTDKVITKEVLQQLEPIIKEEFSYGDSIDDNLDEMIFDAEEEETA